MLFAQIQLAILSQPPARLPRKNHHVDPIPGWFAVVPVLFRRRHRFVAALCGGYIFITPYREIALIREGNAAAAAGLGGAILGFVLPLASTIVLAVPPGGYTVTPPVGSVASARRFRPKARIPVHLHPCRSPSTP